MTSLAEGTFWFLVGVLAYTYAGFPLFVGVVGLMRNRRVRRKAITPKVSLIIPAYNEEKSIVGRLENALAQDYPPGRLEIIVASDGSTDATETLAAAYAAKGVRVLSLPRRGKIHALTFAVSKASGDILVFSDANAMFNRHALRMLVRNFADPEVGAVGGNTVYGIRRDSESTGYGENQYWSYDKWLKRMETLTGSMVSAHGGIHAIRRELYRPPLDSAVTDDFAISTGAVEQHYRLVFDSEAIALELVLPTAGQEFSRKVRLMTRGFRGVVLKRRLLDPFRYGFYSIVLFSHKVLRRLVPWLLLALLGICLYLSGMRALYFWALVVQLVFYGVAGIGYSLRGVPLGQKEYFYIPFFFCMANIAAAFALCKLLRGRRIELWQPQRHEAEV